MAFSQVLSILKSAPSIARAFAWRGVTLRFPALSRSGVRGDDGMVVFAIPRARVHVNDWGCSCPLWLPSDAGPGRGEDDAGGLERLQHCRLAIRHGEAEGFLLDGNVAPATQSEALALRVVKAGKEYWATWGSVARVQVFEEPEKRSFRAYA
jgi:hypothetical protein